MGQALFKSGQIMGHHITPAYWLSAAALQVTLSYRQNGNTIYNKHFEEFSEAAQVKYL